MAGTVALAAGLGLAFLAGLRAIQTETGRTFAARNSWLPYLICLAGAVVIAALAGLMVVKAATKSKTKTKHRDNLAGQSAKGGQ
ncbi:MAG: hypothetical protein ACRD0E_07930, partial [Acidimicrobiales bacterium]